MNISPAFCVIFDHITLSLVQGNETLQSYIPSLRTASFFKEEILFHFPFLLCFLQQKKTQFRVINASGCRIDLGFHKKSIFDFHPKGTSENFSMNKFII